MKLENLGQHLDAGGQILKTRDDHVPVPLSRYTEPVDPNKPFTVPKEVDCSWAITEEPFGPERIRPRIEPWLTALVQSEHLSLLVGSGLTHGVHGLATPQSLPGMGGISFDVLDDEIQEEARRTAKLAGRDPGNFEDQIRAANELLRGLEIIGATKGESAGERKDAEALRKCLTAALESFAGSILDGERDLVAAPVEMRTEAFNYLVSFLMSFASRTGTRERLNLFTTNYDRYIEAGADVAGLRLIDRFVGTLSPVFRASRLDIDLHYNPPGIRGEPRYLEGVARFTKLHGSIDWVDSGDAIRRVGLPFGAPEAMPYFPEGGLEGDRAMRLMVYPNAAKDRETASHPYVELFRDFAATICRPNSTLVCYGYSFGDEHINRVIEDMLTIPSAHLVVIAYSDSLGRVLSTYERLGRHAQVTLMLGDHLGDLRALVDHYLPKPAIDRTAFRMAELLKARWATGDSARTTDETSRAEADGSES